MENDIIIPLCYKNEGALSKLINEMAIFFWGLGYVYDFG